MLSLHGFVGAVVERAVDRHAEVQRADDHVLVEEDGGELAGFEEGEELGGVLNVTKYHEVDEFGGVLLELESYHPAGGVAVLVGKIGVLVGEIVSTLGS